MNTKKGSIDRVSEWLDVQAMSNIRSGIDYFSVRNGNGSDRRPRGLG